MVCLPEVINLHQKSNNVKMSLQHLQLSEPVFGLFLSDAQHGAFLQTQSKSMRPARCGAGEHPQDPQQLTMFTQRQHFKKKKKEQFICPFFLKKNKKKCIFE